MKQNSITRRNALTSMVAAPLALGMLSARADEGDRFANAHTEPIQWGTTGFPTRLSPAQRRAIRIACEYADRHTDEKTGLIYVPYSGAVSNRESFWIVLVFMMTGDPSRRERAKNMLSSLKRVEGKFSLCSGVHAMQVADEILDEETRALIRQGVHNAMDAEDEDIIAGRNINLPLLTWVVRIAGGVMFDRPDLVDAGVGALEKLTDLVAVHGSTPEFNSPTYEAVTLEALTTIEGLGEPRTARLAGRLRQHLWTSLAWRWHPRLGQLCGPWSRAYHDALVGGSSNIQVLADMVWGAFYDEDIAREYDMSHQHAQWGLLTLSSFDPPAGVKDIALNKQFPLTTHSAAEQVAFRLGSHDAPIWIPGGIAELTTWMDEQLAVGTATRSHLHGLYNATYVAQWTRTGERVERLSDLGQAFTRFAQNGRRPGEDNQYHNQQAGNTADFHKYLWADDGRPFALQSGPTALIAYVPKKQERRTVKTLEAMMVVPRLDTVDAVLVEGKVVDTYEGPPDGAVVVRSGKVALGLRFTACDSELCPAKLVVERTNDHLLVGLRLVDFPEARELPEAEYRRYAATIGAELRYAPTDAAVASLVKDMANAGITDEWETQDFGGPRRVAFSVGETQLYGRFEPISETWLCRTAPEPPGRIHNIEFHPGTLSG